MKISIIIPAFNEEKTIEKVIGVVQNLPMEKEIIVVDDGSTDRTREILAGMSSNVKIIYHEKNMGKGMAIRSAIPYLTGDVSIIQDADLEYDPKEYGEIIKPIIEGKTKVVYGSRFLKHNKAIYLRYYLGNKVVSALTSLLFCKRITDEYTCYKMLDTEVLKSFPLKSNGFEIEAELTVKLLRKRYRIYEVPISYNPRSLKEGKKISWRDAVKGIFTILKYRFVG